MFTSLLQLFILPVNLILHSNIRTGSHTQREEKQCPLLFANPSTTGC